MSESIRSQILNNLKTTLETISITNGYYQDIINVYDDRLDIPESFNDFPILFIIDTDETKTIFDVDSTENNLEIIITGYLKKLNDEDNIQLRRRYLQADLEEAIMQDERRNELAIATEVKSIKTDKGIIEPYAIFDMAINIKYYTNKKDPYIIG